VFVVPLSTFRPTSPFENAQSWIEQPFAAVNLVAVTVASAAATSKPEISTL